MAVGGISRERDGRAWVLDRGGFAASTRDGGLTWVPVLLFSPKDDPDGDEFMAIPDSEIDALMSAARKALSVAPVREMNAAKAASYTPLLASKSS